MNKTYTLSVYNTLTGKYENVSVTEEVYRVYTRTGWNISDNNASFYEHEIQFSGLIGGDEGTFENFREFVISENATTDTVLRSIRTDRLYSLFSMLTKKEREVLELLYFENYSAQEVGKLLGISEQAVNKRKRSAFEKIKSDEKMF